MGRVGAEDVAGHQLVEQDAQRREVLLHLGGRELALQLLDERDDVEGLHLRQLVETFGLAPLSKAARGVQVRFRDTRRITVEVRTI